MGMSQEMFIERHRGMWRRFEGMLDRLDYDEQGAPVDAFPERYREVCRHLAVARSRGYSPRVRARLEKMVERGHSILYRRHRRGPTRRVLSYAAGGFARDVRRNWRFLSVAVAAFVVPWVVMMAWVMAAPEVAVEVLGAQQIYELDVMYGGDGSEREASDDLTMFAYYIYNNVGIALRTFGAGVLAGVGSLVTLVFNGYYLGGASGYVEAAGYGESFWPFVIGHGSLELTAIVLSGMAGLKIGAAPIWPGRRGRIDALRHAARESVGLIVGVAVMLVAAAFVEAFWSPRDVEPMVRYVVGTGLWALVLGYFALAGRGRESR